MKYERYHNKLSLKNKFGRLIWNVCWVLIFRIAFTPYLNFLRINLLRLFGAKIGKHCKIDNTVKVWAPWNLEVGDLVAIGFDTLIYNPGKVTINNKITISQRSHICSASHDFKRTDNPLITKPIIIEDRAWVAADCFIGMGVTVGQGAVVGARAVVFKDIEPWTVVGGNPAKFIKKREFE